MGKIIHISVRDKVALYSARDGAIICGNDDYQVQFALDPEWDDVPAKARFIWNGQYEDAPIVDGIAKVPRIIRAHEVGVGVYSEDESLQTTTAAHIPCSRSILCDTAEPTEDNEAFYASEAQEAADRAEAAAKRAEAAGGSGGTGGGVVIDPESVNQAQEAAQAAQESAEAAATSAEEAGQAQEAAEAAQGAAEAAKGEAEGARDTAVANAEAASTSATVAAREAGNASKSSAAAATDRTAAQTSAAAAEASAQAAGQSAEEAGTSKDQATAARDTAAEKAQEATTAATAAQAAQEAAEAARDENERVVANIPTALPNPRALTIAGIGYDGSAAKEVTAEDLLNAIRVAGGLIGYIDANGDISLYANLPAGVYTLNLLDSDGNVVGTTTMTVEADGTDDGTGDSGDSGDTTTPTNFFSKDADGFISGGRCSAEGEDRTNSSTTLLTNYIATQSGDVFYVKNFNITTATNCYQGLYDADKTAISGFMMTEAGGKGFVKNIDLSGEVETFIIDNANAGYIRICGGMTDTSKIVINIKRNGEWR